LHLRRRVARFVNIESVARRKLIQLDAAATLEFMRVPRWINLQAHYDMQCAEDAAGPAITRIQPYAVAKDGASA
jgi:plasmid maintenance system antidote protein VapI